MKRGRLDWLLVPVAVPETRWLRAMRRTLLVGFVAVASGISLLPLLARAAGRVGTGMLAGLCLAVAVLLAAYGSMKLRADGAPADPTPPEDKR